ncbi:component of small subunit processosome [Nadsonia fulvescens var. elongata DSM 6958]|uniref:U three protein 7 n=1 Tax=Nadsonia fulvescens var. elongata DSM 6958 TaxID=857566 RepID=A0A1E3PQS3_9ASCO|nr:component of small subunit processosome [Nadsonia fulvescens var. elongata DSM 6958]
MSPAANIKKGAQTQKTTIVAEGSYTPDYDVTKYNRGQTKNARSDRSIKDKKLKGNLKKLDEKFSSAAKSAASTEMLLMEDVGFLEAEGMERTFKFKQDEIQSSVDVSTAKKGFNLKLDSFGPYSLDYSRNGRNLLLGGKKGHLAGFDWQEGDLMFEINVNETVHDVKWLQNNNFFAAAQKKYTYIYDNQGVEIHCLKKHIEAKYLEYLPYHFLLASAGNTGFLKYQDISTGQLVSELRTKLGSTTAMAQNPYNAVMHLGHSNGTVTLWSPNMSTPLVKMLTNYGPVQNIAIDRAGRNMVTTGTDRQIKIWDIRNFKESVHSYYSPTPANSLSISDTGLLAVGWGGHVSLWKDALAQKQNSPYMQELFPGNAVSDIKFCPFEDVLGVGHQEGFSSLIIPGSGEANYDALEINPFESNDQKRETEVRELLNKLRPEMISLDPNTIGKIDKRAQDIRVKYKDDLETEGEANKEVKMEVKAKTRGKNSSLRRHLRKKTANVIDQRRLRIDAALQKEKKLRQDKVRTSRGQAPEKEALGPALMRFK